MCDTYKEKMAIDRQLMLVPMDQDMTSKIMYPTGVFDAFALLPICMGTHLFQNGDPMGTQISVKWGPNGDPRQQNGDPKSACLQN